MVADRRRDLAREFERVGLSLYEARAYLALLESQPANGYDLARTSGIPTSKIYETLQRLVRKGCALASATEPTVYRAVPPDELIAQFRQEADRALDGLSSALSGLVVAPATGVVWRLKGYKAILSHLISVTASVSEELCLSVWPDEAAHLAEPVALARQRGVRLWIASFGATGLEGEGVYDMPTCGSRSEDRLGRRLTAVVADGRRALVAELRDDTDPTGALTDDPSLALVVKEFIVHDILDQVLVQALGQEAVAALQLRYPGLAELLGPVATPASGVARVSRALAETGPQGRALTPGSASTATLA